MPGGEMGVKEWAVACRAAWVVWASRSLQGGVGGVWACEASRGACPPMLADSLAPSVVAVRASLRRALVWQPHHNLQPTGVPSVHAHVKPRCEPRSGNALSKAQRWRTSPHLSPPPSKQFRFCQLTYVWHTRPHVHLKQLSNTAWTIRNNQLPSADFLLKIHERFAKRRQRGGGAALDGHTCRRPTRSYPKR